MSKLVDHVPNLLVTLDFAPGKVIRNPEYAKFFLWNPEYLALETGIGPVLESGIRSPKGIIIHYISVRIMKYWVVQI